MNLFAKIQIFLKDRCFSVLKKILIGTLNLQRINLSFDDEDVESIFLNEYFEKNIHYSRICHIVVILFMIFSCLLDITLFHDLTFVMISLGTVVPVLLLVSGLVLFHLHPERFQKYSQIIFTGYLMMTGGSFIGMSIFATEPHGHALFLGLVCCLIIGYAVFKLFFSYAAAAGVILCICYILLGIRIIDIPLPSLVIHGVYLLGINALGMVICYNMEVSERRDFYLNRLLKNEKAITDQLNLGLEKKVIRRTEDLAMVNLDLEKKIEELQQTQKEREILEQKFLQAQKMEAVGRLAGGVAHDYNNMLGVIIGYAELIASRLNPGDSALGDVSEIIKAANRSRDITRQLLAFSRKQVLTPTVLDLNRVIHNTEKSLNHLIDEKIRFQFIPCPDIWKIKVDASQMAQILLNLVINAQDAMPDGGDMTVETFNVCIDKEYCKTHEGSAPGHYVLLAITDTGMGIDREAVPNIFEPFYTTKDVGKGTGLGLSTVYGIVRQSGGFLNVHSQEGKGTTFKIYFPRSYELEEKKEMEMPESLSVEENFRVLLVEDEPMVRQMISATLKKIGYRVIEAENPGQALEICKKSPKMVDLLLTDIMMPEMDGRQLLDKINQVIPNIRTLFMSGYAAETMTQRGILNKELHFIQKPFSRDELASKVREVKNSG